MPTVESELPSPLSQLKLGSMATGLSKIVLLRLANY